METKPIKIPRSWPFMGQTWIGGKCLAALVVASTLPGSQVRDQGRHIFVPSKRWEDHSHGHPIGLHLDWIGF